MAKARSRAAARRMKDKWKAKSWYNVVAPASFDQVTIAETLSDEPNKLLDRVTEVSLQDLTNDFRKSHYKLLFKIHDVEDTTAHTQYIGHTLTSDYLRRMVRRKRSKVEAVYDITTRDGAKLRIKPFATTDRRIQSSQKKIIRDAMRKTIVKQAKASTLSEFIKTIIDGKLGKDIYQASKKLYPVKRIEIYKTQVLHQPRIQIDEPKKEKPVEEKAEEEQIKESVEPESKEETSSEEEEEIIETEEEEASQEEPVEEEEPPEEEPEKKLEEETETETEEPEPIEEEKPEQEETTPAEKEEPEELDETEEPDEPLKKQSDTAEQETETAEPESEEETKKE
ncbi:MAG: 30S ribosomal protein S3ae [Thermoplasmatota archaeon]